MVADALSRKSMGTLAYIVVERQPAVSEWQKLMELGVELQFDDSGALLGHVEARPILLDRIREAQKEDSEMQDLIEKVKTFEVPGFSLDDSGVL